MQQIFVELYNYKPTWLHLTDGERAEVVQGVIEAVIGLKSAGVDVLGAGMNAMTTDHRAPYDFFCVYRVPSPEFQREFERQVAASGWYDFFDQVNVSGDSRDFDEILNDNARLESPGSI